MHLRAWLYTVYLTFGGLLLLSCAILSATPTPDLVATEVAVQKTAAAVLTAEAPTEVPVEVPTEISTQVPPTPTFTPSRIAETPSPDTSTASTTSIEEVVQLPSDTPTPLCTVSASALNLRTGPGTVYAPPIGALSAGMELSPLAFSAIGFPSGQWAQVQVLAGGQVGWVSAGPEYISCNVNLADLPLGVAPPTPTATATPIPTSTPIPPTNTPIPPPPTRKSVPPDGGDLDSRIFKTAKIILPDDAEIRNGTVIFRHRIVFQLEVYDPNRGSSDGAGIREVRFTINDPNEGRVHERTERQAGYCVFGGGEPHCNVWVLSEHDDRWPDGEKINKDTTYSVDFRVVLEDSNEDNVNWMWSFRIER